MRELVIKAILDETNDRYKGDRSELDLMPDQELLDLYYTVMW
jgi:hypothetical protein